MLAERSAFQPVWWARAHPHYRVLLVLDEVERLRYPSPLAKAVIETETVSRCLRDKHEGENFRADRIVMKTKSEKKKNNKKKKHRV